MNTTLPAAAKPIPAQKGAPLLGSLPEFRKDLVGAVEHAWKEHGDVVRMTLGPRKFLLVSHPDLAQEALIERKREFQRPKTISGGTALTPLLGQSVLTTDGDSWLSKRRMMQPIFHRQRIERMGGQMTGAGAGMLDRWASVPQGQVINFSDEMKLVTLDIINRTMFSVDVLRDADIVGNTTDISLQWLTHNAQSAIRIPLRVPTPANRRFLGAKAALDAYLYSIIRERRQTGEQHGDLLDMLLAARDEDTGEGMSDEQVRNEVVTIYGAGHETTAVALTWAWVALNQNPEALKILQAEIDAVLQGRAPAMADLPRLPYALQVFEETMRLYPPVPMSVRMAYESAPLGEYIVPKGNFVAIAIHNIHRHPDFWERPNDFVPERFAPENKAKLHRTAYMPFFSGPHLCIGNNFALMEGQLLLATMAQKYVVKLAPDQKVERDVMITMRPKGGLKVTMEPRQ